MTEKSIRIKDQKIYYRVSGSGKPVVMLHGFAEDHDLWRYQLNALTQDYKIIIPDLPGSGKSGMIADMSIEGMADSVKLVIEQETNEQVTIIGHSMGGYIALALSEKYPQLLNAFGLFHSTAFADTEEKKATRRRGITFIQTHGSHEFIKQSSPNLFTEDYRIKNKGILEEMIARYSSFEPSALVNYYEAMIQRPDRTAVLKSFNKPILFIIGKQDKAVSIEDSMKQCHLPQMATIHILENAAHMGMWEEKEKSSQALLSFLQLATETCSDME